MIPAGVEGNAGLARLTTIGTGGPARFLARPRSATELTRVLAWAGEEEMAIAVIGLGSNLLVADEGYDGVALHLEGELAAIEIVGERIRCGGGASLAAVVRRSTEAALTGIEFGCAIPGTAGGAVRMNAGAYGSEIRDVLVSAEVVSAKGVRSGGPDALDLRYRHSNVLGSRSSRMPPRSPAACATRSAHGCADAAPAQLEPARKARTFGSVFKNPTEGRARVR
jgi:UDP-N-acetylmuramate dehydrogenase